MNWMNWSSLHKARIRSWPTTKLNIKNKPKSKSEYVTNVYSFYNKDHITKTFLHKNLTKRNKDQNGNFECVAIRVRRSPSVFTAKSIGQICYHQLEFLRPKKLCLKSNAKYLVCCCVYHTSIEYNKYTEYTALNKLQTY